MSDAIPAAYRLPRVIRGQQVIDRRTGETWFAGGWASDLSLRVWRSGGTREHRIPWDDVAAAAPPPPFWANRIGAGLRARHNARRGGR